MIPHVLRWKQFTWMGNVSKIINRKIVSKFDGEFIKNY